MKKLITMLTALTLVLTLVLSGCAGSSTIKVGLLAPTSGALAPYGQAVKNSTEMAVKEINDAGGIDGKQVELVSYDNEGDATKSVNLFNKLVDNDKIVALVGPVISSTSLAVAPIADEYGIPMISPTATNKDVTPGYDYVFRACYIDPYQGSIVAKFAAENVGGKTAAVMVNTGSDYSVGLADAFTATFTELGGTIVNTEAYTDADKDFNAVLTKIKASNPDIIFIPDYFNMVGVIGSQIQEQGINAVLLGGDGWDGIQNDFADVAKGNYFANHYATDDPDPIVQNFISAYEKAYGETPNALGALAYDATKVLLGAIESAGSTKGDKIQAALASTDVDAVCGHITFDENGDPVKAISMITVNDAGNLELYTKVSE